MRTLTSLPPCLIALLTPPGLAQAIEDVVVVERREDIAARNAARDLLGATTITVRGPLTVRDLGRVLAQACGGRLNFVFVGRVTKAADVPPLEIDLVRATPMQVLALVRDHWKLQPVWRAGMVCLVPEDEVEEATWLQVYDVRAETMPLRDFPGPVLRLPAPGEETDVTTGEEEPRTTVSGFTADQLVALVREHATDANWEGDRVSISAQGGILAVRQTERGHRAVRRALAALGIAAAAPGRVRTPQRPDGRERTPARPAPGADRGRPQKDRGAPRARRVTSPEAP
ncbi:MAG TPA: hypothetical protein VK081_00485 [Planctomycetota bacterium]|nr:hypothetical protein [Planctomycetota bacterium]